MKTKQHRWVKHTITPVEVLPGLEGEPIILVDPDKQRQSEIDAAYGCIDCNVPMNGHFGTDCTGKDDDD